MKKFKSILAIMLTVVMIISTIPMFALAATENPVIVSLKVDGVEIDVSAPIYNSSLGVYVIYVPIYSKLKEGTVDEYEYTLPTKFEVEAEEGATVVKNVASKLTKITAVNTKYTAGTSIRQIDVKRTSDSSQRIYYICAYFPGANIYSNGGMEINNSTSTDKVDNWKDSSSNSFRFTPNGETRPGSIGKQSGYTDNLTNPYYNSDATSFKTEADTTYIASMWAKAATGQNNFTGNLRFRTGGTGDGNVPLTFTSGAYYVGGSKTLFNLDKSNQNINVSMNQNWQLLQGVFKQAEGQYISKFGFLNWSALKTLHDDMYLGRLQLGDIYIEDNENNDEITVSKGETTEINLNVVIENQLGTTAGFEEIKPIWNCDEGIEVDQTGKVTVPEDAEEGTYTVTATSNITINNIGAATASYTVNVVDGYRITGITSDIGGLGKPCLNDAGDTYTIGIPVKYLGGTDEYVYKMPTELNITFADGTTVSKNVINEKIDLEVGKKKYTIQFEPMGVNMYEDAGFESGINTLDIRQNDVKMQVADDLACNGSYSINVKDQAVAGTDRGSQPGNATWNYGGLTFNKGKTYLHSTSLRLAPDAVKGIAEHYYGVRVYVEKTNKTSTDAATIVRYREDASLESLYGKPDILVTDDWKRLQATITPTTDTYTARVAFVHGEWKPYPELRADDYFAGELIMSGVRLCSEDGEIPSILSTKQAKTYTLTPEVLTQLGTSVCLKDITSVTIEEASINAPGVTYENGVLTVPANTEGNIEFTIKAVPNDSWTTAPQYDYEETITIRLTADGGFDIQELGGYATVNLNYINTSDNPANATMYFAIYDNSGDNIHSLVSVYEQPVTIEEGETLSVIKSFKVGSGKTAKAFLWTGGYKPLVKSVETQ